MKIEKGKEIDKLNLSNLRYSFNGDRNQFSKT